jgi:hypothetical protein
MVRAGEVTSHGLYRQAVTSPSGIVPPAKVAAALGHTPESPVLPGWVQAWIDADGQRPWPPEI